MSFCFRTRLVGLSRSQKKEKNKKNGIQCLLVSKKMGGFVYFISQQLAIQQGSLLLSLRVCWIQTDGLRIEERCTNISLRLLGTSFD